MRLAVLAAVVALAACGGSGAGSPRSVSSIHEWAANVAIVIHQLRSDVDATQLAGVTRASARDALQNESDVYVLLVAYTDLAGCRSMVVAAGTATPATERVDRFLASACTHAVRASALFTRAIRSHSGAALLAAATEAGLAQPSLVRAAVALGRVA